MEKSFENQITEKRADETNINKDQELKNEKTSSLLERFEKIKKRRQQITERSSAKRIRQLQNSIIEKVAEDFKKTDDIDILISHQISLPNEIYQPKNTTSGDECEDKSEEINNDSGNLQSPSKSSEGQAWMDFKPYLNINAHLQQTGKSKYAPKTKLEKKIDLAIELGEFSTAEQLSDHLAVRELGKKVVDAIDAKRYVDKKKKEDELLKAKQKKKLNWCFDHKQRWETKSNM